MFKFQKKISIKESLTISKKKKSKKYPQTCIFVGCQHVLYNNVLVNK